MKVSFMFVKVIRFCVTTLKVVNAVRH
jgi:hypothetical protein